METIENNRTTPITGLGILRDLDSFNLVDINEAIEELENNIGKSYFGNAWSEKLQILYSLKKFAETKKLNMEISRLKETLTNRLVVLHEQSKAWEKTAKILNNLQAERKGREFVRDGLKNEIERLEGCCNAFDLIGADDIQALSAEIGVDPNILANGVMEIIAKRNSGVNK